jgi:hypothetical protein
MPITNWSTVGGDLRVPHFIGLHAIQVFVLTVLVLTALGGRISWLRSERARAHLTGSSSWASPRCSPSRPGRRCAVSRSSTPTQPPGPRSRLS